MNQGDARIDLLGANILNAMKPEDPLDADLRMRFLVKGVAEIDASTWDALDCVNANPFLHHAFLNALESEGCLGDRVGWRPCHVAFEDTAGQLLGALPLYLKDNSFGEFVFDGAWAQAYHQQGLSYFPKLVVAVPFTPAMGPRILTRGVPPDRLVTQVIMAAGQMGVSGLHLLFANDPVLSQRKDLLCRIGCQFHWSNAHYQDFEHFLRALTSKRRKEILRERRQVAASGLTIQRVMGSQVAAHDWVAFHRLYQDTFDRHGNFPALTQAFFRRLGETLGDALMMVQVRDQGDLVAAAFFLLGEEVLYGRYWGARVEVPGLHFEACYYQGIEFAIERGLSRFEPGAQGEHKISRGFLPSPTYSYHWLSEPKFKEPVARHVALENQRVNAYMQALMERSPYRCEEG